MKRALQRGRTERDVAFARRLLALGAPRLFRFAPLGRPIFPNPFLNSFGNSLPGLSDASRAKAEVNEERPCALPGGLRTHYEMRMVVRAERLCILSRKRSLYSTARLVEAAEAAGARPIVMNTLRCTMVVGPGGSKLLYRGAEVGSLSAVIPRIGTSITSYGMAVVNHLETMGVPVVNSAPAIARSRDKVRSLQLLAAGGVDIPRTVMAHGGGNIKRLVEEVGGLPCIIKLLRGTQGVGVMIANSLVEAQTVVQTFWELGQDVCLQEFITESRGRDVRALVVGDRVVGAMRRTAKQGEFRSNIHRGGEGKPVKLEPSYVKTAVAAARIIGLEICGVDLLEGTDGPKVMELNSSPGFEGLERATKKDIAGAMVRHALVLATKKK